MESRTYCRKSPRKCDKGKPSGGAKVFQGEIARDLLKLVCIRTYRLEENNPYLEQAIREEKGCDRQEILCICDAQTFLHFVQLKEDKSA
jgi:hypothetical protein